MTMERCLAPRCRCDGPCAELESRAAEDDARIDAEWEREDEERQYEPMYVYRHTSDGGLEWVDVGGRSECRHSPSCGLHPCAIAQRAYCGCCPSCMARCAGDGEDE